VDLGRNSLQISGFKEHIKNDLEEDNGGRAGKTNMAFLSQKSFDKGCLEENREDKELQVFVRMPSSSEWPLTFPVWTKFPIGKFLISRSGPYRENSSSR